MPIAIVNITVNADLNDELRSESIYADGAGEEIRTLDFLLGKQTLCH